jgi:hypothetical protein
MSVVMLNPAVEHISTLSGSRTECHSLLARGRLKEALGLAVCLSDTGRSPSDFSTGNEFSVNDTGGCHNLRGSNEWTAWCSTGCARIQMIFRNFITTLAATSLSIGACSTPSPHENFRNTMDGLVGVPLKYIHPGSVGAPGNATEIRTLPDGSAEYRHEFYRECIAWISVDKRNVITGWRTEGNLSKCMIPP